MEITNHDVAKWLMDNKDKVAIISQEKRPVMEINRVIPSLEGTILIETKLE